MCPLPFPVGRPELAARYRGRRNRGERGPLVPYGRLVGLRWGGRGLRALNSKGSSCPHLPGLTGTAPLWRLGRGRSEMNLGAFPTFLGYHGACRFEVRGLILTGGRSPPQGCWCSDVLILFPSSALEALFLPLESFPRILSSLARSSRVDSGRKAFSTVNRRGLTGASHPVEADFDGRVPRPGSPYASVWRGPLA